MIDARELRIGNLVKIPFGIGGVYELCGRECWLIFNGHSFTESKQLYESIQPIELTEDVLIKCGFKYFPNNKSFQFDTNMGFSLWGRPDTGINVYVEREECGESIKYLHQLQNLYYCLIGEELEIKL
jgi:hypothetical protein